MSHTAKYGGLVRAVVGVAALAAALLAACGGDSSPDATVAPAQTPSPRPVALAPTQTPAAAPSPVPAAAPPRAPTPAPTPTAAPTLTPTPAPSPTAAPTHTPTFAPTLTPSPTAAPTHTPTPAPTQTPHPTATPAPTQTPPPTRTPPPTAAPVETPSSADAFLSRSLRAMGGLESYRYSMKIDVATVTDDLVTNMPISVEGAYRAPDRYSAVLEVNLGFFGKLEIPIIAIGDKVYIQDPNFEEWQKVGPGEDLSYFDPDFIAFLANPAASVSPDYVGRLKNLRLGATETIDGADARAVSFTLPDGGADDQYPKLGEVDVSVWIGVADAVMRRIDAVGDLARDGGSRNGVVIGGGSGLRTDVTFRSSAALRDFDAVADAIKPPILGAAGIQPTPFVVQ